MKIFSDNPTLVKIVQKYEALYLKTYTIVFHLLSAILNLYKIRLIVKIGLFFPFS